MGPLLIVSTAPAHGGKGTEAGGELVGSEGIREAVQIVAQNRTSPPVITSRNMVAAFPATRTRISSSIGEKVTENLASGGATLAQAQLLATLRSPITALGSARNAWRPVLMETGASAEEQEERTGDATATAATVGVLPASSTKWCRYVIPKQAPKMTVGEMQKNLPKR